MRASFQQDLWHYTLAKMVDACAAAGTHYIDLASEPRFLAAVQSCGERHQARIAICPGASTMPGLVELSAAHLTKCLGAVPSAFEIFLSMGSANRLTPGLLASLTLPLGVRLHSPDGGVSYRQLRRRQLHGLGPRLFGRYPSPFDAQGLNLGNRRVLARFWVGLDRTWIVYALRGLSYLRPRCRDRTWIAQAEKARPLVALANLVGGRVGGLRIEALDLAGQSEEAQKDFAEFERQSIAETNIGDNSNHELIAYYVDHAHLPEKALEVAKREIARRQDVSTLDCYAWALAANGDYDTAHSEIEKAILLGVKDPKILSHAGIILGHWKAATKAD